MTRQQRDELRAAIDAEQRRRFAARPQPDELLRLGHGTTTGYRSGCRCDACREASADARRARRVRQDPEVRRAADRAQRARHRARAAL